MNDDLRQGTVCPICGKLNSGGYYRPSQGNQAYCNKHTKEEIDKWLIRPEKREPKIKNLEN